MNGLVTNDEQRAQAALLMARLVIGRMLARRGRDLDEHPLADKPERVLVDGRGVQVVYEDDALAFLYDEQREEILEVRTRTHWLDVYAFDRAGRYLGFFKEPLAAQPVSRRCAHCGEPLDPLRTRGYFCSDPCRIRAHHRRRAGLPENVHPQDARRRRVPPGRLPRKESAAALLSARET